MTISTDSIPPLAVTRVDLQSTSQIERSKGLLAFLKVEVNGCLELNGIALRRTREGELRLSFPARDDRYGNRHFYVHPTNHDSRLDLEDQVLQELGYEFEDDLGEES